LDFATVITDKITGFMTKAQEVKDRTTLSLTLDGAAWGSDWASNSETFDEIVPSEITSFDLIVDGGTPVTITIPYSSISSATTLSDVAAHIQTNIDASELEGIVECQADTDHLEFVTPASALVESLEISFDGGESGTTLGFQDGDSISVPLVARFEDVPGLINLLLEILGVDEDLLNARYATDPTDPSGKAILFHLSFDYDFVDIVVPLAVDLDLSPVGDVSGSADLSLSAGVALDFDFGIRFGADPANLTILGQFPTSLGLTKENFTVTSETWIYITLDKDRYNVTIPVISSNFISTLQGILDTAVGADVIIVDTYDPSNVYILKTTTVYTFSIQVPDDSLGLSTKTARTYAFEPLINSFSLSGQVVVALSNADISAKFGFIDISAEDGSGAIEAGFNFSTIDAFALSTLRDLFKDNASSPFDLITGSLYAKCEVTIPAVEVSLGFFSLSSPAIYVDLLPFAVGMAENFTLPKSSEFWSVTTDFPSLDSLSDLSFADILNLLLEGLYFLAGDEETGREGILDSYPAISNVEIPFIGVTVSELADFATDFVEAVKEVQENPSESLRKLELQLETILGLENDNDDNCVNSCNLEFVLEQDGSDYILLVDILLDFSFEELVELNIDMESLFDLAGVDLPSGMKNIIDFSGAFKMDLSGGVKVALDFGVELSSSPSLFVRGTTGVTFEFALEAQIPELELLLGPIEITLEDGSLIIDADGDPGGDGAPVSIRLGLPETGNYTFSQLKNITQIAEVSFTGSASASFSIFGQQLEFTVDDLKKLFDKDNSTGTIFFLFLFTQFYHLQGSPVTIQFPSILRGNLTDLFTGINPLTALLTSPAALVDSYDQALGQLESGLSGAQGVLRSIKVPVVGGVLSRVNNDLVGSFRDKSVTTLRNTLTSLLGDNQHTSLAEALREALEYLFEDVINPSILLSDGVELCLKDVDKNIVDWDSTNGDPVPQEADAVEWRFTLGNKFSPSFDPSFNLGISGVPFSLSTSGAIDLEIGWQFELGFGISLTDGFYLVRADDQLLVYANVTTPGLTANGQLFILEIEAADNGNTAVGGQISINVESSDPERIKFSDIKKGFKKLFTLEYEFGALVELECVLGTPIDFLPEITTLFRAQWVVGNTDYAKSVTTEMAFLNIELDASSLVNLLLKPIFDSLKDFIDPMVPILFFQITFFYNSHFFFFNRPIFLKHLTNQFLFSVMSLELMSLYLTSLSFLPMVNLFGPNPLILISFTGILSGGPITVSVKGIDTFFKIIEQVQEIYDLITELINSDGVFPLGDYTLFPEREFIPAKRGLPLPDDIAIASSGTAFTWRHTPAPISGKRSTLSNLKDKFGGEGVEGINLPLLQKPSSAINLLVGGDVDLFTFGTPVLEIQMKVDIVWPYPFVLIRFQGGLHIKGQLAVGYDTFGIRRAIETGIFLFYLFIFFDSFFLKRKLFACL